MEGKWIVQFSWDFWDSAVTVIGVAKNSGFFDANPRPVGFQTELLAPGMIAPESIHPDANVDSTHGLLTPCAGPSDACNNEIVMFDDETIMQASAES